jgi:hypothetical protein
MQRLALRDLAKIVDQAKQACICRRRLSVERTAPRGTSVT